MYWHGDLAAWMLMALTITLAWAIVLLLFLAGVRALTGFSPTNHTTFGSKRFGKEPKERGDVDEED